MSHYLSNLRDLEFNLFEVFGSGGDDDAAGHPVFGRGLYADLDPATARDILSEVDRIAREQVAPSFAPGDRNPPQLDPGTHAVTVPDELRKAYQALMAAEYWRLDLPAELGGTLAPRALWWALAELVLGANAPVWMYASGPSFAHTVFREGTPQQQEWAKLFVAKQWAATMVLTEPDAGSDVGAGRTRAIPQPDGSWHIDGVKRFITGGEHDLADNIIHYVLARPDGAGPGTKGLSLFIVPKFHFDETTGELGERNGVFATNLEHKLGIKVSTTCELAFGQHGKPAKGWLLGEVHEGIRQMFLIIEYARMMVGTKAIATLSTGYLNALAYARQRVQGPDLLRATDKTAPRVTIIHHPDVRRSLLLQKSYAEGLRALVCYTAGWQDRFWQALHADDPAAAEFAKSINDLLLPVVKGVGSERASELLGQESLQTFGGSGYLQDYPLEQYLRDAKIDTLYEGTTAIQSLDFFFRKIVKDQGAALLTVAAEIQAFAAADPATGAGDHFDGAGDTGLKHERQALATALENVQHMVGAMTGWLGAVAEGEARELYRVGLTTRRLLLAVGDLLVGWLLLRQAEVALRALGSADHGSADESFYRGKVAAARFFTREVLPRLAADREVIMGTTWEAIDLPEDCF